MANHKSALKRVRQTKKRTERNRFYRTRMKNIIKDVKEAVASGNKAAAIEALKVANKRIHEYVSKGIIKKNNAARKVSKLHKLVNSMNEAA
ncbi:30S ribosomal protein S20 [Nitratiruptor sp. SB155-2]|uniref:Small ribosomal subunit protein bS20 n=1 Tax=Nitratiruptor sp. (strain SB155-2) TaxID=387092 RepID=RS20_NITSB|nr:30S ribosomal protein S20 [Nitratiruptor sp. SB155-2]A6Q163.1 RecName: Full=Small ribosomal subunit protein bS20; AltName: Full=30S ribosomal protein S20 [Nitratiruptor sp. SB155-2]BAF69222.1 30S ribosomal protein S20 [Nitratiruptor sp. SB155-2]